MKAILFRIALCYFSVNLFFEDIRKMLQKFNIFSTCHFDAFPISYYIIVNDSLILSKILHFCRKSYVSLVSLPHALTFAKFTDIISKYCSVFLKIFVKFRKKQIFTCVNLLTYAIIFEKCEFYRIKTLHS